MPHWTSWLRKPERTLQVQAAFFERTGDEELMALTRNARVVSKPKADLDAITDFDIPGSWANAALGDAARDAIGFHTSADHALLEA
ncbi:hypothetical protein KSS93_20535 [Pseudomonas xanthosomatis]|uniref:hypothetical protein n=1 Tax=Pseudomonas xanthosomatis TaxID=2842356 RepID=UPI001C3D8581|nr:hypothetical protein [Pseudomonas xanthosomatis]QXH45242.1 hypothetical protein KSS93_20535 [Pseudomonas xanthosomatis]